MSMAGSSSAPAPQITLGPRVQSEGWLLPRGAPIPHPDSSGPSVGYARLVGVGCPWEQRISLGRRDSRGWCSSGSHGKVRFPPGHFPAVRPVTGSSDRFDLRARVCKMDRGLLNPGLGGPQGPQKYAPGEAKEGPAAGSGRPLGRLGQVSCTRLRWVDGILGGGISRCKGVTSG